MWASYGLAVCALHGRCMGSIYRRDSRCVAAVAQLAAHRSHDPSVGNSIFPCRNACGHCMGSLDGRYMGAAWALYIGAMVAAWRQWRSWQRIGVMIPSREFDPCRNACGHRMGSLDGRHMGAAWILCIGAMVAARRQWRSRQRIGLMILGSGIRTPLAAMHVDIVWARWISATWAPHGLFP